MEQTDGVRDESTVIPNQKVSTHIQIYLSFTSGWIRQNVDATFFIPDEVQSLFLYFVGPQLSIEWLLRYLLSQGTTNEYFILTLSDSIIMPTFKDMVLATMKDLKDMETKATTEAQNVSSYSQDIASDDAVVANAQSQRDFFQLLYDYALMGHSERKYLIENEMIAILGHFYLEKQSPYLDSSGNFVVHYSTSPVIKSIPQLISLLLCSCHTPTTNAAWIKVKGGMDKCNTEQKEFLQKSIQTPVAMTWRDDESGFDTLHSMSDRDKQLPHCRQLYDKMLTQSHEDADVLEALINLFVHWSYDDKLFTREVLMIIHEGVDKSGAEQVKAYLAAMRRVLMIEDTVADLRDFRLKALHFGVGLARNSQPQPPEGVLDLIKTYRQNHQPFTYECIKALTLMMMDNEYYAKYMLEKRSVWQWWDKWLDHHVHRHAYIQNEQSELLRALKISFYEDQYIPFLAKNEIMCERNPVKRMVPANVFN